MQHLLLCDEYESGYGSEYDGIYGSNFVFYDEEFEGSDYDWDDDDIVSYDEDESDDLILEEIPFVYCPGSEETGEA